MFGSLQLTAMAGGLGWGRTTPRKSGGDEGLLRMAAVMHEVQKHRNGHLSPCYCKAKALETPPLICCR